MSRAAGGDGFAGGDGSASGAPAGRPLSFAVLGRRLRATVATPALAAWLERLWRHDRRGPASHPYRIVIEEADAAASDRAAGTAGPRRPASRRGSAWKPAEAELPGGRALRWRTRGDDWRYDDGAAGLRAHFGATESRILVRGAASSSRDLYPALYVAVCEAVRLSGLIPLHAAVVARRGRAIALAAPSGTGKTTALLALLDRGWRPVAEDLSWLDPETLTVYGWDHGVRLWPDAIGRSAPALTSAAWRTDVDGKALLEWDAFGASRVDRARLVRLVLLERDGARPSALEPLPRRDAVPALWEATGVPLTRSARRALAATVGDLVLTMAFARIRLGRTPIPDPDAAAVPDEAPGRTR